MQKSKPCATAKKRAPKRAIAKAPTLNAPVELMAHQQDALARFDAGMRFQYHAWHRRAGKDWFGLHLGAREFDKNPGTYWHLLPKHVQARRAIWHGVDHQTGRRFMDLFFGDLAAGVNNTDMFVEGENGSTWQLLGSDNYDRMVGANPRGVIFSEWALCDPRAWDYIRPILRANGGWAIFISTFRGRNHAWQMYERVKNNPEWYVTLKTIDDTSRLDGARIVTKEQVEADRVSGMSERLIQQEYYCQTVPPIGLGPYARAFAALSDSGGVHDMPATAINNAAWHVAVGECKEYKAFVECSIRGQQVYIHGGNVASKHTVSELLAKQLSAVAVGRAILSGPTAMLREVVTGGLEYRPVAAASSVETCSLIERSTVAPSSVASAALTGGLLPWLDDEDDEDKATQAVYNALEHLATATTEGEWGAPLRYNRHDLAVIAGRRAWQ